MKVSVTYLLDPPLRLEAGVEVATPVAHIALLARDGLSTALTVSISGAANELAPQVTQNPSSDVRFHIDVPTQIWARTQTIARTFMATLVMRGHRANVSAVPSKYVWARDVDGETEPPISELNTSRERRGGSRMVRLDEVIQSAASVHRMLQWVEVVEFHNAGVENFLAERYADSLRYSFFVVESLYGAGKTNPKKIVAEFVTQPRMAIATRSALRFPSLFISGQVELHAYRRRFEKLTWQDALLELANTRGRISHHSRGSPLRWTVANQQQFQLEATLMVNIAHRIVWKIARHELWSAEVVEDCGGYVNE